MDKKVLDNIYKDLGYSSMFKDFCKLYKEKEIYTSGYQLKNYKNILDRYDIKYKVLDNSYYFTIAI